MYWFSNWKLENCGVASMFHRGYRDPAMCGCIINPLTQAWRLQDMWNRTLWTSIVTNLEPILWSRDLSKGRYVKIELETHREMEWHDLRGCITCNFLWPTKKKNDNDSKFISLTYVWRVGAFYATMKSWCFLKNDLVLAYPESQKFFSKTWSYRSGCNSFEEIAQCDRNLNDICAKLRTILAYEWQITDRDDVYQFCYSLKWLRRHARVVS